MSSSRKRKYAVLRRTLTPSEEVSWMSSDEDSSWNIVSPSSLPPPPPVIALPKLKKEQRRSTSTSTAAPGIMSKIKEEVDLTGEEDRKPAGLDEETKRAFGAELVGPTPVFSEDPFFKVDDLVRCYTPPLYNGSGTFKGYSIKAVAWSEKHKTHVYKVGPADLATANPNIVLENHLTTLRYTVNDIVKFTAFGSGSTRTIKDVLINDDGTFYYAIAGGFQIRDTDITELVARR